MPGLEGRRSQILALPLIAACGLTLLGSITADERGHQRQLFEARLINEMLDREASARPGWQQLPPLPAHPKLRRIRIQHSTQGTTEIWLDWREYGGYAGPIDLAVGFDARSRITRVRLLRHTETPGLGDRLEHHNSDWLAQFIGIGTPGDARLRAQRGQIDAMSGATITSAVVARGVERSLTTFVQVAGQAQ